MTYSPVDRNSTGVLKVSYKSIEIYYDIAAINGSDTLGFRNEAMHLVEKALEQAGLGEWAGAESGLGEVNFGFEVTDFDQAEALIRKTLAGTRYAVFREIARSQWDESNL